MRNIDSRAIRSIGIPGSSLMERAGYEVVEACLERFGIVTGKTVMVFCGKGNNGGDGFVIAREMKRLGASVSVFVFAKQNELKGDPLQNYSIAKKMSIPIRHIASSGQLSDVPAEADIVIDALLGTGVHGAVKGVAGEAIRKINSMDAAVVSVDLPSGLNSDNGSYDGSCVTADLTVTMGLLKRGLLLHPGKMMSGEVVLADIGFPGRAVSLEKVKTFLIEKNDVISYLPRRLPYYSKGDCGRIFILGGSTGMTGAPAMTAAAALRSGAGMTLLGIPKSLNSILEQKLTETMTLPLPETEEGSFSLEAEDQIMEALVWADVLAIGPGLGRDEQTIKLVHAILEQTDLPAVIDADGLYAVSKKPGLLKKRKGHTVITPHAGEFSRLIRKEDADNLDLDRIEIARKYARHFRSVVHLKGAPSVTASTRGEVYINPTGNAGMATAGSGDVLTGIIAGLAGQGLDISEAVITGTYIHGHAGDFAAAEFGEISMTAGDIIDFLPYAFEDLFGRYLNSEN
jgi:hydroxyethylthiazole kinase-like uncharacterized protein yjeF